MRATVGAGLASVAGQSRRRSGAHPALLQCSETNIGCTVAAHLYWRSSWRMSLVALDTAIVYAVITLWQGMVEGTGTADDATCTLRLQGVQRPGESRGSLGRGMLMLSLPSAGQGSAASSPHDCVLAD